MLHVNNVDHNQRKAKLKWQKGQVQSKQQTSQGSRQRKQERESKADATENDGNEDNRIADAAGHPAY